MKVLSQNTAFGGMQGVFSHDSQACKGEMTFAVYRPAAGDHGALPGRSGISPASPAPMPT